MPTFRAIIGTKSNEKSRFGRQIAHISAQKVNKTPRGSGDRAGFLGNAAHYDTRC